MNPPSGNPRFSIVIPVRDRPGLLEQCLASVAADDFEGSAEVIVACDGGPAAMRQAAESWRGKWPLRWMDLEPRGPSAARNTAVGVANGELILFLNDDVRLLPGFLAAHDEAHQRAPGHTACGNCRWDPDTMTTDFMHWVAHHDQIYYTIEDHEDIGWEYFHTLNASVDRRWFERGLLFDESFPDPAFEDTEYAYRASRAGMKFRFAGRAVLHHSHWFEPDEYLGKSHMRGRSARRFLDKFPEQAGRILDEYREAARRMRWRLAVAELTRRPDGPREWHARFGMSFLAGYEGRPRPWLARHCNG